MKPLPAARSGQRGSTRSTSPNGSADAATGGRLEVAAHLCTALADTSPEQARPALEDVLAVLAKETGATGARLCEFGDGPQSLRITAGFGGEAPFSHGLGQSGAALRLAAQFAGREIVWVPDSLSALPLGEPVAAGAQRALLLAPLYSGASDLGGLVLEYAPDTVLELRDGTASLLRIVGGAISALLARCVAAARQDTPWLMAATELMPGVLCQAHFSPEGELEFRALSGTPTTGIDLGAALENPALLLERVDPRDRERLKTTLGAAARDLAPWALDFRMTTVAGEQRWVSARAFAKRAADGGAVFTGMALDITAQKLTEATLVASEARYRALFDCAPIMMHTIDTAGRIVSVNRKWLLTLGYDRDEAVGRCTADFLTPASRERFAESERTFARTGGVDQLACQMLAKNGEALDVMMSVQAERGAAGEVVAATFCSVDVTELNSALRALKESEARYRAIVHDQTELICRFDPRGRLQFVSHAVVRRTGRGIPDLLGTDWFELVEPEQHKGLRKRLRALDPARPSLSAEVLMAESERWYQWTIRAFFDVAGTLTGYQAVGRDIQELKSLEKQIREIGHREQSRIGHDLHDGLGQELTGAALLMKTLERDAKRSNPELLPRLQSLREVIDRAIATTRALAQGLSPLGIEREGLVEALRQLVARTETVYGIAIESSMAGRNGVIADPAAAMDLYRIAQEALNNAAKHSGARLITLRLAIDKAAVTLEVADDGRGLPEEGCRGAGMGLQIMQHRASMIGAALEIGPGDQGGTVVRCMLKQSVPARPEKG